MRQSVLRLPQGGMIDREQVLPFRFDGRDYHGYAGDTLASALLANGVRVVARSFKYHRARGIYSAGPEEPNALVTLRSGGRCEPNTRATVIELYAGLDAHSQHCWPSLQFDIGVINSWFAPLFVAGFYYKTFIWPGAKGWLFYERWIRKAAGLGRSSLVPDPDDYEHRHAFCDVLVIGAGPAGLAAALTAGRSGARLILVDENPFLGGASAKGCGELEPEAESSWREQLETELRSLPEVQILTRTTAFGYYDGNVLGLVERVADHLREPLPYQPRQRHWIVRARQVILATGAIERALLFAGNDLPGVMLAGAARSYINRYAVRLGRRAVVFTNNDHGYRAALDVQQAGADHVVVVDPRPQAEGAVQAACREHGIRIFAESLVRVAEGRSGVRNAVIQGFRNGRFEGTASPLECDLVLSSGGWSPAIQLHTQAGGKPVFDPQLQSFVPGEPHQPWHAVGACNGEWSLAGCLRQGVDGGQAAARQCGFNASEPELPAVADIQEARPASIWTVPDRGKCFVDLQNDVTIADIELAQREGYDSPELVKRYTTLGMGTDQGKLGNVNALAVLAAQSGVALGELGVTSFRPPYTPVALGALAGERSGAQIAPLRRTPLHGWHERAGVPFVDAGLWKRAQGYPQTGESRRQTALREARRVRETVGVCDISTLGKIEVQGPDAALFLDRAYANRLHALPLGKTRYALLLREDGFVYDDGTVSRIDEVRFFVTSTTANAEGVLRHLEYLTQVIWPELRLALTSVTEQWCALSLAGPRSRDVLRALLPDDVENTALPFMGMLETVWNDALLRILRVSFSGERAYELYTPADYGVALWKTLLTVGEIYGIAPYGLDALDILRIEKGHVTAAEIDGRRTAQDLGLAGLIKTDKDFVGRAMLARPGLQDAERLQLVGFQAVDRRQAIPVGAQLVRESQAGRACDTWGHVSSACFSPALEREIGLGFLRGGCLHQGETFYAADPLAGRHVVVEIVSPHFYDPDGELLHD